MRLSQVLIAFALLVSCTTSLEAGRRTLASKQHAVDSTRSLRVAQSTFDEERIIPELTKWFRTTYWLNSGKTDEYVKKALGLDNLSGATLKSAPNYVYYEHFLDALEGRVLKSWLAEGKSTKSVWADYKLEDIPTAQLKDNEGFKTYLRYAIMEDNYIFKLKSNDQLVKVDYSGTRAEMNAKVDMWISLKRPNWYVKKMLNLDHRSINAFRNSPNYPRYERFEDAMQEVTLKDWLAKGYSTKHILTSYKLHEVPLDKLERNDNYKMYVRYATMVDDEIFNGGKKVKVEADEIPLEVNTKVEIWASKNRPNEYVEEILGLNGAADKTSANYKYYEYFLTLKKG
ncbi:hypothetical protein JG687_00016580 [Phytophthora cactorum]|uniref:RxLR effector protein n=1 Tax=Phytophthora cactorum TaxID=29920 RepID=A0A329S6U7_9STRA|nr:hypothetical protein Pcac1_g26927 [Phytophthora cactorum]KAG2796927.1 hypothetical protein PC111_g21506 [Phytophthora cactorum]KAG2797136.1 hypothetical protein PC112_g21908 [Phytophthora cactorum]KAG2826024.1 hypothetical protein PC113_g21833 [Phytophthora cactorum]KAG2876167.1 hypothetical protein PC114_g24345 [Phytophthora cactorum]